MEWEGKARRGEGSEGGLIHWVSRLLTRHCSRLFPICNATWSLEYYCEVGKRASVIIKLYVCFTTQIFLNTALITKQPNKEDKFPISVFYTLLRLNGFPLCRVAPILFSSVFACILLKKSGKRKGWGWGRSFVLVLLLIRHDLVVVFFFGGGAFCHLPIPPKCGDSQICFR